MRKNGVIVERNQKNIDSVQKISEDCEKMRRMQQRMSMRVTDKIFMTEKLGADLPALPLVLCMCL